MYKKILSISVIIAVCNLHFFVSKAISMELNAPDINCKKIKKNDFHESVKKQLRIKNGISISSYMNETLCKRIPSWRNYKNMDSFLESSIDKYIKLNTLYSSRYQYDFFDRPLRIRSCSKEELEFLMLLNKKNCLERFIDALDYEYKRPEICLSKESELPSPFDGAMLASFKSVLSAANLVAGSSVQKYAQSTPYDHTPQNDFNVTRTDNKYIDDLVKEAKVFVQGDIHGDADKLLENLKRVRLVNNNQEWIGGDKTFIVLGDIIDRGPKSIEAYEFLKKIKTDAEKKGGKVEIILGNHELMTLQGNKTYSEHGNGVIPEGLSSIDREYAFDSFRSQLYKDIKSGIIKPAVLVDGKLYSHAGINGMMQRELAVSWAKRTGDKINLKRMNEILIDEINHQFKNYIEEGNFKRADRELGFGLDEYLYGRSSKKDESIFKVGHARNGRDTYGGIFWSDSSENNQYAEKSLGISQVVGHSPKFDGIVDSNEIVYADTGMSDYYDGAQSMLVIGGGKNEGKVIELMGNLNRYVDSKGEKWQVRAVGSELN